MNRRGRGGRGVTHVPTGILRVLCVLRGSMVLPLAFSVTSVTSLVRHLARCARRSGLTTGGALRQVEERVASGRIVEPSVRDDRCNATRIRNVGQRVRVEQHQVRDPPRSDGA